MLLNERLRERIKAKKALLDSLRPLPRDAVERLRHQMNIELTYNSNAIEGNTLTLQETRLILEEGITVGGKPLNEYLEAQNHEKALEWTESIAKGTKKITEETILETHEILMKGTSEYAGRYRDKRIRITGASFTPPAPQKLLRLMRELVKWMQATKQDPIEKAALAHHKLVWIHPFFDGNGRTARLLMNLMLFREGYPPTVLRLVDRKKYYRALKEADKGNPAPLVNFIARAVEQSLNIYLEALQKPGKKTGLVPLSEAAKHSPYSQEYLSLLSRRGLLGATKIGRKWHVSLKELDEYTSKHGKKK
ncbi:Fic family protein [archaeon]